MIFDRVISPAFETLGNLCPLVASLSVTEVKNPLLFFAPLVLLDHRIQMVVPPLTALFADAPI